MAEEIKIEQVGNRPSLHRWMVFLCFMGMLIFAGHASTHMVAAGDTWVAMACGRHFANHGVDTVEPFSANSHQAGPTDESMAKFAKQLSSSITDAERKGKGGIKLSLMKWWLGKVETYPSWSERSKKIAAYMHPTGWINQNWLTHLIFYKLVPKSTYTPSDTFTSEALVYWKFAIYIAAIFCVYFSARLLGAHPALSAVFACFALFTGRSFLDIRPAGFSNLGVAVFLLIVILTTYRNVLYIWLIVPLVAFWANVHGGYIYTFIMLVPFVGLNFIGMFFPRQLVSIGKRGLYNTIGAGAGALLVSIFLNPFKLTNLTHTFIISISEHAEMWRQVHEWHPAFEWSNPVGTSFPFLILFILSIGLFFFWLMSRSMKPRLLKAPVDKLNSQKAAFDILSRITGWSLAIFVCWVAFISFSFVGLDFFSFLLCAAFVSIILLSIYRGFYFIGLMIPFTLLAMLVASDHIVPALQSIYRVFNSYYGDSVPRGFAGRYIYPFLIIPTYLAIHSAVSIINKKIKFKFENVLFVAAAALISFVLMIAIFNPFRFESFWNLKQYFSLHRLWSPVYEGRDKLDYGGLFNVLYLVNFGLLAISGIFWVSLPEIKKAMAKHPSDESKDLQARAENYKLPRIDPALIAIAGLTIYMAIKMRRFIPAAGIAAGPVLAMFIDQMVRAFAATRNFYKGRSLRVPAMPYSVQLSIVFAGGIAVIFFGTWWSLKFKTVYLDPWPQDTEFNSVFMRMTASDAKPFHACKFIKDNKLEGKMFNYWTEGGFIAWGQEPDPQTGKTSLQLFMDGRAQAAYEPEDYALWNRIMLGGPTGRRVKARNQEFTGKDYREIGGWINGELKKRDVWVVLMPGKEFGNPVVRGLDYNNDWRVVFFNSKQKMFVDVTTEKGEKLFRGIFSEDPAEKTKFPTQFSEKLTKAYLMSMSSNSGQLEQALNLAMEAFKLNPSGTPLLRMFNIANRMPHLQPRVLDLCREYFDDFIKNKDSYLKQDGYHHRIGAAIESAGYIKSFTNDVEKEKSYERTMEKYEAEQLNLINSKRW